MSPTLDNSIKLDPLEVKSIEVLNLQANYLGLQIELFRAKQKEKIAELNEFGAGLFVKYDVKREEYDLSACGKKLVKKKT
jgi:hypothetical protein